MSCGEDHCITCSDEAVPMRIDAVGADGTAICDGVEVMTDLVAPVAVGDIVLVHAGTALQVAEAPQEVPQ